MFLAVFNIVIFNEKEERFVLLSQSRITEAISFSLFTLGQLLLITTLCLKKITRAVTVKLCVTVVLSNFLL